MVQPMDCLTSRDYDSVIFVGPQRTGKTQALIDCWANYAIQFDPSDMMLMFASADLARDYSLRRLDRMIANNPSLREKLIKGHGDNVYDKQFVSGNIVNLSWPSIAQLRQRDIRFAAVSELDSIATDIDGAGELFSLLQKRTQTYLSGGKTLAESAPSKPVITDIDWTRRSDHDAMPAEGVAKLYQEGDRRRFYWQCLHCKKLFQAAMVHLKWDERETAKASSETAFIECPHCGGVHKAKQKQLLNEATLKGRGGWFRDGELDGKSAESNRASFWLEGVPAGFQSWESIVYKLLSAQQAYSATGDSSALKTTINSDQGLQFVPPKLENQRDVSALSLRAEDLEKRVVADGVGFLTCSIDQQKNRFVVQVMGWGKGRECWIVDRYNIAISERVGDDGKPLRVEPSVYLEDWAVLGKLAEKNYKAVGGQDVPIRRISIDSGGAGKATENAYAFMRQVKARGIADKFRLTKGDSRITGALFKKSESDKKRAGVGLFLLATDALKDTVDGMLNRESPGDGYVHFPRWLGDWFYAELGAEHRTSKGWRKRSPKLNNEALDLMAYNLFLAVAEGIDKINWDAPPAWATIGRQLETSVMNNQTYLEYLRERGNRINGE